MTKGNGKTYAGGTIRCTDDGKGCVWFRLHEGQPPDAEVAEFLGRSVGTWINRNPDRVVVGTAGIVSDGSTVGVNLWYRKLTK